MNEQLVVKNFGPIKDATVDFKRVTVFIGPTGGGKSTLAKLAAVFRDEKWLDEQKPDIKKLKFDTSLNDFQILDYIKENGKIIWDSLNDKAIYTEYGLSHSSSKREHLWLEAVSTATDITKRHDKIETSVLALLTAMALKYATQEELDTLEFALKELQSLSIEVYYIPADRAFGAALTNALAGLALNNIALPETLLNFLNQFNRAQNSLLLFPIEIPFLRVAYKLIDKKPQIDLGEDGAIDLERSASGIQAVAPMMLTINYTVNKLDNAEITKSFIVEEPELNLYPTAQQGLLSWLVEKCTKGENDLTITTHSPYLLAHFNTLLFAHQVAQNHPERADEIAKIVPRESWLDPKEFAAYHVEGQKENGVRSIINPETGLISYNGLDAIASAEATEFEKLLDINAGLEVEW